MRRQGSDKATRSHYFDRSQASQGMGFLSLAVQRSSKMCHPDYMTFPRVHETEGHVECIPPCRGIVFPLPYEHDRSPAAWRLEGN